MNTPTNIQFDSDQTSAMTSLFNKNKREGSNETGLTGFLLRNGIVKSKKGADMFMIGISTFLLLGALYLFFWGSKPTKVNPIGWGIETNKIKPR